MDRDSDALIVRQKSGKAAWPPISGLQETEGISVHFTLSNNQVLAIDVATQFIALDEKSVYQRANGLLKGGILGGRIFEGRAYYE